MRPSAGSLPNIIVALLLTLLLAACDLADQLTPPEVVDTTGAWRPGSARRLTVEVRNTGAHEVRSVFVRYSRHHWPGLRDANQFAAVRTSETGNTFLATPPDAVSAPRGDHLFWQWVVEYGVPGGLEVLSATSSRRDQVIECNESEQVATLRALGNEIWPFATQNPHDDMWRSFYFARAHGLASLAGVGVTWASSANLEEDRVAQIEAPLLLFFAPRVKTPQESDAEYLAAIGETEIPDPAYRLVGAAWTEVHRNAKRRPSLGCIPSSQWFVHESGFHKEDGRMLLVPPDEAFLGQRAVRNGEPTPAQLASEPADATLWHPRIWDLHVWLPATPAQIPFLSIYRPQGVPGVVPCANDGAIGESCANRIFFFSETFE